VPILETAPAATSLSPRASLAPGDRAPDFVLADETGAFHHFTERARGNPILLLLLAGDAPTATATSEAAARSAIGRLGVDLVVIRAGDPPSPAERGERVTWLGDPKGKILAGFATAAGLPRDRPAALLLDANQRVIDLASDGDLLAWAEARIAALPPPGPAHALGLVAPVLIVPNVLDRAACRALIERWERIGHDEGSVTSLVDGAEVQRVYHAMKKRRDHAIQDPALLKDLIATIGRRIAPELDRAFGFRRFRFDRFIVTCYDAERGDYFRRHRDNASAGTSDRRFALTLNLNTEEHDGGDLLFPEYGPHHYRPPTGGAILFACGLLHEALPVTRGRRFTLLSFLRDPAPAPGREAPRGAGR
jgi:predicted 2-oxoglutarate/Fe(II)-dependent dioxygenase YbiX